MSASEGGGLRDEVLQLSPSNPVAVSDSRLARVELQGDLAGFQETEVLR